MKTKSLLYGLLAEFDNPEALKVCVRRAREDGFRRMDAYTPFPVEGMAEELGIHHTVVPFLVLSWRDARRADRSMRCSTTPLSTTTR